MKRSLLFAALIFLAACVSSHPAAAPVTVVVFAQGPFERADATLLRTLTDDAIRRSAHGGPARTVAITVEYQRDDFSSSALRSETVGGIQITGAMYTISDPTGRVLESQWVPMTLDRNSTKLAVMHETARWIAARIARLRAS